MIAPAIKKVKEIWSQQSKLVKYLIIAVVACLAIYALVAIIIGIFTTGQIIVRILYFICSG
jgi:Fe2+ transport system protein B